MLWPIFDNLVLIYETLVLFFLARHILSNQRKESGRFGLCILLILVLHHLIAQLCSGHVALTAFWSGIIDYLLFGLLWPKQWRQRLFTIFFYYALMLSLDLLLIFTFPIQPDHPCLEQYQFLCIIASRSLLFFILLAAVKLGSRERRTGNRFLLIAPLPALISIALLFSVYGYEVYEVVFNQHLNLTVLIILLAVLVLLFAYTQLMRHEAVLQDKLQAQELLRKEQEQYCDGVMKGYLAVRSTRHDLHHYLGTVSVLIQSGQYHQAMELCGQAGQNLGPPLIYTGNETVDAVLYSKQILFQQSDAVLRVEGCLPPKLDYDSADICVILSNALENALEAVVLLPVGERVVTIRFLFDHWLLIIVSNKLTGPSANRDNLFHSAKPGNEHGIGLDSIAAACKRQNGYLEINIRDGTFLLSATLQPKIILRSEELC